MLCSCANPKRPCPTLQPRHRQRRRQRRGRPASAWKRAPLTKRKVWPYGVRPAARQIFGVVIGLIGIVMLMQGQGFSASFTGLLAMLAATVQHRQILRRLRREDFVYREEPSIALATAISIALIGILALVLLLAGALAS